MTQKLIQSRGSQIDLETCVENSGGNRFNLILIAAARAKELKYRHKVSGNTSHINAPMQALLEIQEGKIGEEYLKRIK